MRKLFWVAVVVAAATMSAGLARSAPGPDKPKGNAVAPDLTQPTRLTSPEATSLGNSAKAQRMTSQTPATRATQPGTATARVITVKKAWGSPPSSPRNNNNNNTKKK